MLRQRLERRRVRSATRPSDHEEPAARRRPHHGSSSTPASRPRRWCRTATAVKAGAAGRPHRRTATSAPTSTPASTGRSPQSRRNYVEIRGTAVASNSIGLIELSSIAAGFQVCRRHAQGRRRRTGPLPHHLQRQVHGDGAGDVGGVQAAVEAGCRAGDFSVIDTFVIPNVHESIFPAHRRARPGEATRIARHHRVVLGCQPDRGRRRDGEVRQRQARRSPPGDGARRQGVRHRSPAASPRSQPRSKPARRPSRRKGLLVNKVVIA